MLAGMFMASDGSLVRVLRVSGISGPWALPAKDSVALCPL